MSAIIVLTPVIVAAWPMVSASVLGAATALGFAAASKNAQAVQGEECVDLEVKNSQAVTAELGNDQSLSFVKDGVTVTFARDARGKCGVRVAAEGHSREQLEAIGREFSQQVVQQYAYHRLMQELASQKFNVVAQEVGEDRTIHVQVRRFD